MVVHYTSIYRLNAVLVGLNFEVNEGLEMPRRVDGRIEI